MSSQAAALELSPNEVFFVAASRSSCKRAACREYKIQWQTLEKILSHSEPPGYQKTKPRSSIVDAFVPIIEEILKSDRQVHRKQRHTARRIFERLRDEHGYVGGETVVKDAVHAWKQHHRVAELERRPRETISRSIDPATQFQIIGSCDGHECPS